MSTVYLDSSGRQEAVMQDVAYIEARDDGFVLVGLLGGEKFVQGRIASIDFADKHQVVLQKVGS
ncbi:MAG: CooT family nickel-binding protein [Chloroflexi bacterium]|nr:CooT family nickel-binding protein [Chloroflexota bacterium]